MNHITKTALSAAVGALSTVTMMGAASAHTMSVTSGKVVAVSAPITATWSSPSITLTAKPSKLDVGRAATLTVTVPPSPSGTISNGEYVQVYDKTTGQRVGNGVYTGSAKAIKTKSGSEILSATKPSSAVGAQTFVADLWDKGVTHQNHKPSLVSQPVTVIWGPPSPLTLVASPVGKNAILTATYSGTPPTSNGYIVIKDTGGNYTLNSNAPYLFNSSSPVNGTATSRVVRTTWKEGDAKGVYSISDLLDTNNMSGSL